MPAGALLVASGVGQGRGFRSEGEAQSDPGWPALARCMAELAWLAFWLAFKLRVDLLGLWVGALSWQRWYSQRRRTRGRGR